MRRDRSRWDLRRGGARVAPAALWVLALAAGCAKIEPPPGGPTDEDPPLLLAVVPESLGVYPGFDRDVELLFDEVVSEGNQPSQGSGTGDLEKLVVLSPTDQVPQVSWKRSRITIRPKEGWQPNTVYRIELLPGITDLSRNKSDTSVVITFSTGAPLPTRTLRGTVMDWTRARPAPQALLVAMLLPDSLPYRGLADSSGAFAIGPLPAGEYLLYAVVDQNRNMRRDGREAYERVRLGLDTEDVGELWTYPHDTLGPRFASASVLDSLSAVVTFSQMLDPSQRLDSAQVRLRLLPDSQAVAVASLLPRAVHDSLHPPPARTTDTTRAPRGPLEAGKPGDPLRDTVRRAPPPRPAPAADKPGAVPGLIPPGDTTGRTEKPPSRPPLYDKLVLRVTTPWIPEGRYYLEVLNLRNVSGAPGDPKGGFQIPPRRPAAVPDSVPRDSVPADSLRPPPDTVPAPADTARGQRPIRPPRP